MLTFLKAIIGVVITIGLFLLLKKLMKHFDGFDSETGEKV